VSVVFGGWEWIAEWTYFDGSIMVRPVLLLRFLVLHIAGFNPAQPSGQLGQLWCDLRYGHMPSFVSKRCDSLRVGFRISFLLSCLSRLASHSGSLSIKTSAPSEMESMLLVTCTVHTCWLYPMNFPVIDLSQLDPFYTVTILNYEDLLGSWPFPSVLCKSQSIIFFAAFLIGFSPLNG